ncbi:hypothetical protein E2C01_044553 [Portunus trituberculatus]|uniref:Uncharacterized protein n=1 Tax=Portunus trituberculatus TaxID=210409 RepID=A0A5B7G0D2_PORTR|nr:hypothetical protein [Portunus trituberculatus]
MCNLRETSLIPNLNHAKTRFPNVSRNLHYTVTHMEQCCVRICRADLLRLPGHNCVRSKETK